MFLCFISTRLKSKKSDVLSELINVFILKLYLFKVVGINPSEYPIKPLLCISSNFFIAEFENLTTGKNGWHVDHIKPLSSFDLSDKQQLLDAWKLDNLRALWATDNLKKSSFFEGVKHNYGNHRKQETT